MPPKKKASPFMEPVQLSPELEAVIGKGPMPRTEVIKKVWAYIKKHGCQDTKNKRNIIPDGKLAGVIGKKTINMFDMTREINKHLK